MNTLHDLKHKYEQDGYVVLKGVFKEDEIQALRVACQIELENSKNETNHISKRNRENYRNILEHTVNVWQNNASIKSFAMSQQLTSIVKSLLNENIRLFQDQILVKWPKAIATAWHQDLFSWPFDNQNAITVWIPLQEVNEQNGCLRFVKSSHKLGKIKRFNLFDVDNPINEPLECESLAINIGDIHFHNSQTVHYAHSNSTQSPRYAYSAIYIPENTLANGNYYFTNTPPMAGEKFTGKQYPLLTGDNI